MTAERDPARLSTGTLAGKPLFRAVRLPAGKLLEYASLRELRRQVLPLTPLEMQALSMDLERSVAERLTYSYQPVFDNCSTRLRDALDRATQGKLRREPESPGLPLRALSEQGLTGRVLPLLLLEVAGGADLDRASTLWERLAFPRELSRELQARWSAPVELVHPAQVAPLPTSVHAGRLVLLALAALLAFGIARGRGAWRRVVLVLAGAGLGLLALLPWLGTVSALPSLHGNWQHGVLWVTDLVLAWGLRRPVVLYARVRLAVALLFGLASAVGLFTQPLVVTSSVVALIFGAVVLSARRQRTPSSSISKTRVELGGITGGNPRAP